MSLMPTPRFASAAAAGADWREAAKNVLTQLQKAPRGGHMLGFLYITDDLAPDAKSIRQLFASVLGIEHWIGATGIGVCGTAHAYVDRPAIAAMIGPFEPESFVLFHHSEGQTEKTAEKLRPWLNNHDPMLVLAHGDALAAHPQTLIREIDEITGGFMIGGLSSARGEHAVFGPSVHKDGMSGALFAESVKVATTLSQGCTIIGPQHRITDVHDHSILALDGRPASKVFEDDLRQAAMAAMAALTSESSDDEKARAVDAAGHNAQALFQGQLCVAFPVPGSDQADFLVRNLVGIQDDGGLLIGHEAREGDSLLFVRRDDQTVQEDLSRSLLALRERVQRQYGTFEPKAAIYISCLARAQAGENSQSHEIRLIREIIGDIPLAGFYAGGEISKGRLYGYTGILTLFL